MKLAATWTPDCSGKQDYDGEIIVLSTRYWPRGGGFFVLRDGHLENNEARPEIKPSAKASIDLITLDEHGSRDHVEIVSKHFEAETEAEVKRQVEAWASECYEKITAILRRELIPDKEGT